MAGTAGGDEELRRALLGEIDQCVHDLKTCLHAIQMGITLLQIDEVRSDIPKFNELCQSIDDERKKADELIKTLHAAAQRMCRGQ